MIYSIPNNFERLIKHISKYLMLSFLVFVSGCASLPPFAEKQERLEYAANDRMNSVQEAKEGLKVLMDSHAFSDSKFEGIEAGDFSLVVKGFEKRHGTSISDSYRFHNVISSSGKYKEESERTQISIAYKEIQRIQIMGRKIFHYNQGSEMLADTYDCNIFLNDQDPLLFRSKEISGIKRFASALAFLSNHPVENSLDFPLVGCTVEPGSDVITKLQKYGPADLAGIQVFAIIKEVDGISFETDRAITTLEALGPGLHRIKCKRPGEFSSKVFEVMITK